MPSPKPTRFDSPDTPEGFEGVVTVTRGGKGNQVRQMDKGKNPKAKGDHPNKFDAMVEATDLARTNQWIRMEEKSDT
jgi:hypothetical protein